MQKSLFSLLLGQSLSLAFRKGGGAFGTCGFYIIVVTLFTFAMGPEAMAANAGAVMCVALLLASISALPLLFERDYDDGSLEQLMLQPAMLEVAVAAKMAGQWLAIILPMLVISPLLAVMANMEWEAGLRALGLLLLASPTVVALGAIGAALTLGTRKGGLLQSLVVMPLYVPVLIFAASAGQGGAMWLLLGLMCASLPLACLLCAALVRMSQE